MADVSSCFLSEPVDVTKYAIIYGGVQKNIGPAGIVIAIIREDLITEMFCREHLPCLNIRHMQMQNLSYNTPTATASISVVKCSNGLRNGRTGSNETTQRRESKNSL